MMCGVAPGAWTSSIGVLSLLCTAPLEKPEKPMPHFGHQPARSAIVPPPQVVQTPGNARLALIANQVVGDAPSTGSSGRLSRASTRQATRPTRHRTATKPRSRRGSPSARQPASVRDSARRSRSASRCVSRSRAGRPTSSNRTCRRRPRSGDDRFRPPAQARPHCSSRSGPPSRTPAICHRARSSGAAPSSPAGRQSCERFARCRGRGRGRRVRRRPARPGCAWPQGRPTARRARCAVVPPSRAARMRRTEHLRRSRRPRRSRPSAAVCAAGGRAPPRSAPRDRPQAQLEAALASSTRWRYCH